MVLPGKPTTLRLEKGLSLSMSAMKAIGWLLLASIMFYKDDEVKKKSNTVCFCFYWQKTKCKVRTFSTANSLKQKISNRVIVISHGITSIRD